MVKIFSSIVTSAFSSPSIIKLSWSSSISSNNSSMSNVSSSFISWFDISLIVGGSLTGKIEIFNWNSSSDNATPSKTLNDNDSRQSPASIKIFGKGI